MKIKELFCLYIIICFFSCDLPSNEATGLSASRGTHADKIVLSWNPYAPSEGATEPKELKEYVVESDESGSYNEIKRTTETSYTVESVSPGTKINFRFKIVFTDETESNYSLATWGYALTSTKLLISAVQREYPQSGEAGPDASTADWYEVLLQKGWTYHFETYQEDALQDTDIQIYKKDDFEPLSGVSKDDANFEILDWNCTASTRYFVRIQVAATGKYNISCWHD